jgi:hypothetical protein
MGIDGIGSGRPPIGPAGGASPTPKSGETFSLERSSSTRTEATTGVGETADLERLQSGEISLDDYLQTRADKAVAHLSSLLPPEQIELVKEQLVNQMKQDPALAALVQRATGVLPSDNEG